MNYYQFLYSSRITWCGRGSEGRNIQRGYCELKCEQERQTQPFGSKKVLYQVRDEICHSYSPEANVLKLLFMLVGLTLTHGCCISRNATLSTIKLSMRECNECKLGPAAHGHSDAANWTIRHRQLSFNRETEQRWVSRNGKEVGKMCREFSENRKIKWLYEQYYLSVRVIKTPAFKWYCEHKSEKKGLEKLWQ